MKRQLSEIWNIESKNGSWEIINYPDSDKIGLLYFPDPDDDAIKTTLLLTEAELFDLIKLLKSLKTNT
ncbi:hypothetical protein [Runella sp.]|uniref:hypothetical protein n=1 Tax=Runella sp. TaxID=1960881 RepID=UPI003D0D6044